MTQQVLIQAEELAALLDSVEPPVLADVRWSLGGPPGLPVYEAGHLPGAQYVDLETELAGQHLDDQTGPDRSGARPGARPGGRHPLPSTEVFQAAMRRIGVRSGSLVVIYDDASALASARLWWLLTDAGHSQVRVLDGGLAGWLAGGRPLQSGLATAVAAGDFIARPGQRRQVDGAQLAARIEGGTPSALADVRAYLRFTGDTEPMDPVAGHIPGARSAPSADNLDSDGRFRPPDQIRERYRELDAEAGNDGPIFYCGSGITAAQTLLARESAGLESGSIYPGSWSDWISDPDRPVATGAGERL